MLRPSPTAPTPEDEALYVAPDEIHARAEQAPDQSPEPAEAPSTMLDLLAAPFRGAESAVRNTYNGLDFLTLDALPDYNGDKKTNFLGSSETTPGKMVEGVAQFLTAFVPVVGVASRAAGAIGLGSKAATVVGGAASGAFADFVAFDSHEERLSNLIQEYPALQNPVTEYLAAGEDDSEAEGRFKNTLEGLALGALTEPALHAFKALATVRKAKAGVIPVEKAKVLVQASEKATQESYKKAVLDEADASLSKRLSERPELDSVADTLSKITEEDIAGGGLFQDPKKDIGRFINAPEEVVDLLRSASRKQQQLELNAPGKAVAESIEVRNKRIAPLVADLLDETPETVADVALSNARDLTEATYLMSATHKLLLYYGKRSVFYAGFAGRGAVAPGFQTVEQTALEAVRSQQALASLVLASRKNASAVGRALNAIKFVKYAEVESLDLARQAIDSLGGSGFVNAELEKLALASTGTPEAATKAAVDRAKVGVSAGSRLLRIHNEYWLNSILSGPKTALVNTLGNSLMTVWQPLEMAVGGAVNRNGAAVAASVKNFAYIAESLRDSSRFFLKALKENDNFLSRGNRASDVAPRAAIRMEGDSTMAHFVNFMGEAVRMPSRFLMATDEFFKQVNYRAAAKTELFYRGRTKGLDGAALASFVEDNFTRSITRGGSILSEGAVLREAITQAEAKGLKGKAYSDYLKQYVADNYDANRSALAENFDVTKYAKDVADEATFTRDLGALGQDVQRFVSRHPIAQLLVPFVRTPTNIVKAFGQRGLGAMTYMPGIRNLHTRNVEDLLSPNALVRAKAQGRIATGSALVSLSGLMALEGKITGRGPLDENERRILMETGWQPYSIKFDTDEGPVYVSYQRLDPLATFFGLMADWAEQAKHQDPFKGDALEQVLSSAAVAVSGNVTNKTYLASLSQAVDVISQPDRSFAKWSRVRVGSYVPSFLSQLNSGLDEGQTMKEVRTYFDALANRIPGAQGMLEPKRNILGEPVDAILAQTPMSPVNPFTVSQRRGDPVFEELSKFGHGITPPSPIVFSNVNLLEIKDESGRTAYDRWMQEIGLVKVQGKNVRDALDMLIKSPQYQKLPLTAPSDGLPSPRISEVKRILSAYRQAALVKVQQDIPAVRSAVGQSMTAKAALRRGDRAQAVASVRALLESVQ